MISKLATGINTIQTVHCPNCGAHAHRRLLILQDLQETACPRCDYLLVSCVTTGRVIESYAPGIVFSTIG